MKTSKIIGAILIAISLAIGYIGMNKVSYSSHRLNLPGVEINASNESGKVEGYTYLGLAIVLLVGGIYLVQSKKY